MLFPNPTSDDDMTEFMPVTPWKRGGGRSTQWRARERCHGKQRESHWR